MKNGIPLQIELYFIALYFLIYFWYPSVCYTFTFVSLIFFPIYVCYRGCVCVCVYYLYRDQNERKNRDEYEVVGGMMMVLVDWKTVWMHGVAFVRVTMSTYRTAKPQYKPNRFVVLTATVLIKWALTLGFGLGWLRLYVHTLGNTRYTA